MHWHIQFSIFLFQYFNPYLKFINIQYPISPATQITSKDHISKEMPEKKESGSIDEPDAIGVNITTNTTQGEVDTFDHILEVTAHHEAVYAYYYMDENNKVSFETVLPVLGHHHFISQLIQFDFFVNCR